MRFDTRFETVNNIQQPYKAYPSLATSDEVLLETTAALNPPLPEQDRELNAFRNKVKAASGSDPSVIELRVADRDPELAARIANTWAGVFVQQVNDLYVETAQDAQFFKEQLAKADVDLRTTEQALIEFQRRNQASVLSAQTYALASQLTAYLEARNAIERVLQDAASLKARLALQEDQAAPALANDLAALLLQIEALSLENTVPLQLQIGSSNTNSGVTKQELTAFLDSLTASLKAQSTELEANVTGVEPEILRLQGELEQFNVEEDRLTRARDVARDTYTTLARKVDEARIAAENESGEVRLASAAAVPTEPVSPRKLLNTAVAAMLGLMLGVFGVFAVEWWRGEETA